MLLATPSSNDLPASPLDNKIPVALVIAPHGSYRTMPYVATAKRLGLNVVIASQGEHSIISAYSEGLIIDFSKPAEALAIILAAAQTQHFDIVIGTDDSALELAASVANALNLPHNAIDAAHVARRKDVARQRLVGYKLNLPEFACVNIKLTQENETFPLPFPVIVKPLALSGSRGVIRANNVAEFLQAVSTIKQIVEQEPQLDAYEKQSVLVETFIPGQEVAVEGVLTKGELTILSVFDKPEPLNGPYFEETYYITPSRHSRSTLEQLATHVQIACDAYGLQHGPVHAECRINDQGVWIVEVTARTIGGLCSQLFEYTTGCSLEEVIIKNYLGRSFKAASQLSERAAGVLMIPIPRAGILKRVEGLLAAQKVSGIDDVNIQVREGNQVTPLPMGASYLGFIFASAKTPQAAEAALREAHECLNIVIDPLWTLTNTNSV